MSQQDDKIFDKKNFNILEADDKINSPAWKTTASPNNFSTRKKKGKEKIQEAKNINLFSKIENPIWLSVAESSKIGGIQTKTIRRAIKQNKIKYKIINNRYLIDLSSLVKFLHTTKKLKNKLDMNGIGQYVKQWEK